MKLSRFLSNICANFYVGHRLHTLASAQLLKVMRAESDGDRILLTEIAEQWGVSHLLRENGGEV